MGMNSERLKYICTGVTLTQLQRNKTVLYVVVVENKQSSVKTMRMHMRILYVKSSFFLFMPISR